MYNLKRCYYVYTTSSYAAALLLLLKLFLKLYILIELRVDDEDDSRVFYNVMLDDDMLN